MEKCIKDFLNSDLTEAEYYGLPEDDLISLGDYMLRLKDIDARFLKIIKPVVEIINNKCEWVENIGFDGLQLESSGEFIQTGVWLFPKEGEPLITHMNGITGDYTDTAENMPRIYLIRKKNRELLQRIDELKTIQEELHIIDELGRHFYDGHLYHDESVSGNFEAAHMPNIGMHVYDIYDRELIAAFSRLRGRYYDKPYLNDKEKQKVLTKIQMKKTNKD